MIYKVVSWPDSQAIIEHPRFNECLIVDDRRVIDLYGSAAFFVPLDLYLELQEERWPQTLIQEEETTAYGRSRGFIQKGVRIDNIGNVVDIRPISRKGTVTNARISIPIKELYKLIKALIQ